MKLHKNQFIKIVISIAVILISNDCLGRAGGGGGGYSGGSGGYHASSGGGGGDGNGIWFIVIAFGFIIYSAILTAILKSKNDKVRILTDELSKQDVLWNHRSMMTRVEEVFFTVQNAWMARDQQVARDCMSQRIFNKHKLQTDKLIADGQINVLESINLKEAIIFSVSNFKDNTLDTFSAHIKGSMVDYMIDEKTKEVISGDHLHTESFKEIWTFIRDGKKWVLDEIDQDVSFGDISSGNTSSTD